MFTRYGVLEVTELERVWIPPLKLQTLSSSATFRNVSLLCLTIPLLVVALTLFSGCSRQTEDRTEDGRTIVTLWTSWSGIERKGIDAVIEDFNASQDRIFVRALNVTDPQTKIMLATAGGNPPDVAIIGNQLIAAYAENNALIPLDELCRQNGIRAEQYLDTFWDAATYKDHIWALPLTCSVTALHYNKRIFGEAGLDPEEPPKTLEELERINNLIAKRRPDHSIECIGHLPLEPGWWRPEWSNWFGHGSFEGDDKMLFDGPAWQQTAAWLASYHQRFGQDELIKLRSGFGRFSSPQNPFFTGKVAMVLQGVWMNNFIESYADPNFEYGVAPFPASESANRPYYAIADVDLAIIPAGVEHREEAFALIHYLSSRPALEKLALAHGKMTSLRKVSPDFKDRHPHPYLQTFLDIAASGHARTRPQLAHFNSYLADASEAVNSITYGLVSPEQALLQLQAKQQKELDAKLRRWRRVEETYQELWNKESSSSSASTSSSASPSPHE